MNDRLFIGGRKSGFEIGHMMLQFGGEACSRGNFGCFEAYCPASALVRDGVRAADAHPDCTIARQACRENRKIDAKLIIDCAKAGDAVAGDLFSNYAARLGAGIVSAIAILDPEVVALGGGVGNAGAFLLDTVRDYLARHVFFANHTGRVVTARLGNDAAMLHTQAALPDLEA